eukprot:g6527.t1
MKISKKKISTKSSSSFSTPVKTHKKQKRKFTTPQRRRKREQYAESPLSLFPGSRGTYKRQRRGIGKSVKVVKSRGKGKLVKNIPRLSKSLPEGTDNRICVLINGISTTLRYFLLYEWFYSYIDRDFFHYEPFYSCLESLGFPSNVEKLTRIEWAHIRAKIGAPRRFSLAFLKEERDKLNHYRENVRLKQMGYDLSPERLAKNQPFMFEVPCTLHIGQRVTALHPERNILGIGSVLAIDMGFELRKKTEKNETKETFELNDLKEKKPYIRYIIQFDRQDLGVRMCDDIQLCPHGIADVLVPAAHGRSGIIAMANMRLREFGHNNLDLLNILFDEEKKKSSLSQKNITHLNDSMIKKKHTFTISSESSSQFLRIPTSLQPLIEDVNDVQNLENLLHSKSRVLSEIRSIVQHVKVVSNESTNLNDLKSQKNWLHQNLIQINKKIEEKLNKIRIRFTVATTTSRDRDGFHINKKYSPAWYDAFQKTCQRTAEAALRSAETEHHISLKHVKSPKSNTEKNPIKNIRKTVQNAIGLVAGLSYSKQEQSVKEKMLETISIAANEMRPICKSNTEPYNKLMKILSLLVDDGDEVAL